MGTGSASGSDSDSAPESESVDNDSDDNSDSVEDDDEFGSLNSDGTLSDRSGAILGGANGENNLYDADAANSSESLDYYVKITLINMWLILGLIVIINIVFYWCYCRRQHR